MKKLGEHEVNVTFTMNELSKDLRDLIVDIIRTETHSYYDYARFSDKIIEDNMECGLQVYRDYYISVALIYPRRNNSTGEFTEYSWSDLFKTSTDEDGKRFIPLTNYIDDTRTVKLEKELDKLLNSDYTIAHDYDYEQIQEAIDCGDYGLVEDILGDRDMFEFI